MFVMRPADVSTSTCTLPYRVGTTGPFTKPSACAWGVDGDGFADGVPTASGTVAGAAAVPPGRTVRPAGGAPAVTTEPAGAVESGVLKLKSNAKLPAVPSKAAAVRTRTYSFPRQ